MAETIGAVYFHVSKMTERIRAVAHVCNKYVCIYLCMYVCVWCTCVCCTFSISLCLGPGATEPHCSWAVKSRAMYFPLTILHIKNLISEQYSNLAIFVIFNTVYYFSQFYNL